MNARVTVIEIMIGLCLIAFGWAMGSLPLPEEEEAAEAVIAPPCDTMANGPAAAVQLRRRMVGSMTGLELTACDLEQLDSLAYLVDEWADDRHRVADLEMELTECEWGWLIDDRDYIDHVEGTRIDEALDLLIQCAETSR